MTPRHIELLAPARTADIARAAIDCGADAIYIGADRFGARAAAANTVDEIARLCDYAHRFRVRIYATLNTIIYEDELRQAELLAKRLWKAGVDALIVQDMAMLRLDLPPIALHASTQCDIRTAEKAHFLAALGFSQLVLPRELTLDEIKEIHDAVPDTPLRGVCTRCAMRKLQRRLPGKLCRGRTKRQPRRVRTDMPSAVHPYRWQRKGFCDMPSPLPALRDLRRAEALLPMIEAGVSSFKIEGRLKDESYVKNVTAYYRQAIDKIIDKNPDIYLRSSAGESAIPFTPSLEKSF